MTDNPRKHTFTPQDNLDDQSDFQDGIHSLDLTVNADGSVLFQIWGRMPGEKNHAGQHVSSTLSGADWRSLRRCLDEAQKTREEVAGVLDNLSKADRELLGLSIEHFDHVISTKPEKTND